MKLTPKSKILINRALQRIYTRLKRDYQGYQNATLIVCLNHQTYSNSDDSGLRLNLAHDAKVGLIQEPNLQENEIWIMAKDVTYLKSDGLTTEPLVWYQLEKEQSFSLFVKHEKYNEKVLIK